MPAPATENGTVKRRLPTVMAAALLGATGAVGLLHTTAGAPVLARLGAGLGRCPAAGVSGAAVEALHRRGLDGLRGAHPAPARPALGFILDATTLAQVQDWAVRAGLQCTPRRQGLLWLRCKNVPRLALPEATDRQAPGQRPATGGPAVIEDLALAFGIDDRLISVDALTRSLPAADAAQAFFASDARLGTLLGPATEASGRGLAGELARAPLATSLRRYRFSDYVAILTVSNLASGLAVREQYLSGS